MQGTEGNKEMDGSAIASPAAARPPEKYLSSGQRVAVVSEIPGGFVVQAIRMADEEEYVDNRKFIVDCVFDQEPTELYSAKVEALQAEIESLAARRQGIQAELRQFEQAEKARLERYRKTKGLELLDLYLDGKITHFMELQYGWSYRITAFNDAKCQCDRNHMKLLSLNGNSKGDLTWKLHTYCDYSGGSIEVVPCTSYEMARQEIQRRLDAIQWAQLKPHQYDSPIKTADEFGLSVPQKIRDEFRAYKISCLEQQVSEQEAKAAEAKSQLDAARQAGG